MATACEPSNHTQGTDAGTVLLSLDLREEIPADVQRRLTRFQEHRRRVAWGIPKDWNNREAPPNGQVEYAFTTASDPVGRGQYVLDAVVTVVQDTLWEHYPAARSQLPPPAVYQLDTREWHPYLGRGGGHRLQGNWNHGSLTPGRWSPTPGAVHCVVFDSGTVHGVPGRGSTGWSPNPAMCGNGKLYEENETDVAPAPFKTVTENLEGEIPAAARSQLSHRKTHRHTLGGTSRFRVQFETAYHAREGIHYVLSYQARVLGDIACPDMRPMKDRFLLWTFDRDRHPADAMAVGWRPPGETATRPIYCVSISYRCAEDDPAGVGWRGPIVCGDGHYADSPMFLPDWTRYGDSDASSNEAPSQ